jgi:HAD superfamily hydrolase (TIGR01484 family)
MKILNVSKLRPKRLIVFDLDGTLAPTKAPMDVEMSKLIARLLSQKKVAVIGGGKYAVFQVQFLKQLKAPKSFLKHLYLFPTTATSFYRYNGGWKNIYALELSKEEKVKILQAFKNAFDRLGYNHPKKTYGKIIEDRDTQVTFSALGQDVVDMAGRVKGVWMKERWLRKNKALKMKIARLVAKSLPNLEVHAAGFTSIDVTKKGIDKSYGLRQIQKHLGIPVKDMLFVGDAIFPGGNDYAVVKTGVDYIQVKGPAETKKIIRSLIG